MHKFGALIAGMNRYFLITLRDAEAYEEMVEIDSSSAWKMLDVNILNTLILNRIVGITEEELAAQVNVEYTKDLDEALEAVRAGRMQVALILNATRLEDIFTIADGGEKMPRKSTYFYPKPLSGLVFYPMEQKAENRLRRRRSAAVRPRQGEGEECSPARERCPPRWRPGGRG